MSQTINILINKIQKEIENNPIDTYNDYTFNSTFYVNKGLLKAIKILNNYKEMN